MRVLCCLITFLGWTAFGQLGTASTAARNPATTTGSGTNTTETASGPVPVPAPTEKAMRYYRTGMAWWGVGLGWNCLVPLALLFSGVSARMRTWAQRVGQRWFFVIALYALAFALIGWLLDLPLAYLTGFVREHAYGLSNQTPAKWWSDSVKELAVSGLVLALVLWVPYLLLRKAPRRWWLVTGVGAVPFIVLTLLVQPVWIDPLFNRFGPMQDKNLERDILALAARAGIDGGRVYEVDKSVDTKAVNAYVTGFLDTKRIVLWDTTLAKLQRDEVLFVMGHEMGHYVLGHVRKSILLASAVMLLTLYAIHRAAGRVLARCRGRFGFDQLADVASLPLLLLFFQAALVVLAPPLNAISRHYEHEADRFGLELLRQNHAAATAFVKLQRENLSNPRPGWVHKLWRASHPPLAERIEYCNAYRPWAVGQPLRYADRFSDRLPVRQE